ncbi:MAG: hypothetical protein AB7P76_00820 [Candidatus Melainabacteria bacterium]
MIRFRPSTHPTGIPRAQALDVREQMTRRTLPRWPDRWNICQQPGGYTLRYEPCRTDSPLLRALRPLAQRDANHRMARWQRHNAGPAGDTYVQRPSGWLRRWVGPSGW